MTFLPIVERELRVRARQKATFRVRMGAALIASCIIYFFLITGSFSPGRTGHTIFWFLSTLAFLWCLLEGPRTTADALSEEKREGTLGLLFLTDLKPYDVVLGKLLATSLNSFYSLLAILPPLSFPLLLGGITPGEFWRMVLLLIVTLLFSLSAALLISSASRNQRRAWFGAVLLIGFLATVPPLFQWVPLPSINLLGVLSPTTGFYSLADSFFNLRPQTYWSSVTGAHVLTCGFLVAACLVLPRSWQDKPVQKANREIKTARRLRNEVERRRSMYLNPVVWMLTRGARADWYVWAVIGVVSVPAFVISIIWRGTSVLMFPLFAGAVVLNLLLGAWVAAKASFMIADARDSGALSLLLTTPISPRQIVDGHMEALKRQFVAPFIALCGAEVAIVAVLGFGTGEQVAIAVVVALLVAGVMGAQLVSSAWFGLWSGLVNKKPAYAAAKTISYVLLLPLLVSCGCILIALVKDAIFINYARTRLHQQFRNIITEGAPVKLRALPRPQHWPPKLPNVLDK